MSLQPANKPVTAYIGLGSNLDEPCVQVQRAFDQLKVLPDTELVGRSSLYRSTPMGPVDQSDFINAVAKLKTKLTPKALLEELLKIERAHGRVRRERWGPRTLDLDLLLHGELHLTDPNLTVPHPGITERAFVLVPLLEIEPSLVIPGLGPATELVKHVGDQDLKKL